MNSLTQRQVMIIVAAIAVVVAVVAIGSQLLGLSPASGSPYARYEDIPQSRTQDGGFVLGNPDAPVTVVEFGDFACPHCQVYHTEVERFIDEYVKTGQAKFEYRMFISGADPAYGPYTAQLAECAAEQRDGAFFAAHDVLFQTGRAQGRFNERTARTLADRMELDYSELLRCAENADQFQTDQRLGQSLGVQSTPSILIRYGDEAPQFISDGVQTYNRGGVPYQVLQAVVESVS